MFQSRAQLVIFSGDSAKLSERTLRIKRKVREGKLHGPGREITTNVTMDGIGGHAGTPGETGQTLLDLVGDQLGSEAELKQSLESRAMTVITASGAFVTLLLAFASWAAQQHGFTLSGLFKAFVATGVVLLLLATLAGIGVNTPSRIAKIDADTLLAMLQKGTSDDSAAVSHRGLLEAKTKLLISMQIQNKKKARLLIVSICAQLAGLSFVASATIGLLL